MEQRVFTSLSIKSCSFLFKFGRGVFNKTSQSGLPLKSSLSHQTVPASRAVRSVSDMVGRDIRILFNIKFEIAVVFIYLFPIKKEFIGDLRPPSKNDINLFLRSLLLTTLSSETSAVTKSLFKPLPEIAYEVAPTIK